MTIFDEVSLEQLRARTSEKWREYPSDVLPLWVAEMDVPQLDAVVDAVTAALRSGDTGYDTAHAYAQAYAPFARERLGWEVDVERSRSVPDIMNGVAQVLALVTEPGAAVVINPPVYPPFPHFVGLVGRRVVDAPLGADGRLDLATIEESFAAAGPGSGYLLCNPHNPTGAVHTPDELRAVGELARRHGIRVVADEVHAPLTLHGAFTPATTVIPDAIALHSGSKAFNLAAVATALAVPGPETSLDDLPEIVSHGVSHLATIAHGAAFAHGGAWLDRVLDGLRENRALLADLLAEHLPAARWHPWEGTYFAWIDLRGTSEPVRPGRALLERGRLALNEGASFGAGGEGYVGLNLAASSATITEAVRRMAAVLG
ncbi:MalY/PatB family protein [Cellulomonas sp. HZM]|uniref:MalY/PatB family protein n=1 Tax=Cellulomonas sp. HZM TaxID=1454010 RepID=UPI00049315F2|nr:aminotransferase class I/II-fold pyridoxal phosphate-dependent enzyme [Cellulomonas sp. HZM]